jgi:hypothetical protein
LFRLPTSSRDFAASSSSPDRRKHATPSQRSGYCRRIGRPSRVRQICSLRARPARIGNTKPASGFAGPAPFGREQGYCGARGLRAGL